MSNVRPLELVRKHRKPAPRGYKWVFCPYFIHWRSKKRVYRKDGGMFCFLVRAA